MILIILVNIESSGLVLTRDNILCYSTMFRLAALKGDAFIQVLFAMQAQVRQTSPSVPNQQDSPQCSCIRQDRLPSKASTVSSACHIMTNKTNHDITLTQDLS